MNPEDEHSAREADNTSAAESVSPRKPEGFFQERPPQVMEVAPQLLRHWSRRDVLLFGMGAIAAAAGGVSLLPQSTLKRLGIFDGSKNWPRKEWLLNRALASMTMLQRLCIREIAWRQPTPNRRLLRSGTITTEPPPTPAIFQNGV